MDKPLYEIRIEQNGEWVGGYTFDDKDRALEVASRIYKERISRNYIGTKVSIIEIPEDIQKIIDSYDIHSDYAEIGKQINAGVKKIFTIGE